MAIMPPATTLDIPPRIPTDKPCVDCGTTDGVRMWQDPALTFWDRVVEEPRHLPLCAECRLGRAVGMMPLPDLRHLLRWEYDHWEIPNDRDGGAFVVSSDGDSIILVQRPRNVLIPQLDRMRTGVPGSDELIESMLWAAVSQEDAVQATADIAVSVAVEGLRGSVGQMAAVRGGLAWRMCLDAGIVTLALSPTGITEDWATRALRTVMALGPPERLGVYACTEQAEGLLLYPRQVSAVEIT